MKGFPQIIWSPCVIYRMGPEAERHGDGWRYAVVIEFPWLQLLRRLIGLRAKAIVHALSADGEFKISYARPAFRWASRLGFRLTWFRMRRKKDAEREMGPSVPPPG